MSSIKERLQKAAAQAFKMFPPLREQIVPWYYEGEKQGSSTSWLVKDMIPESCVGIMAGESKAGKSFLALHLSVAVSEGSGFFGKSVKASSVLYVAVEGQVTIPGRLHAARRGNPPTGNKIAVVELREPMNDSKVLSRVLAQASAINKDLIGSGCEPIRLVLIDTMIAAFAVKSWNDASEVSEVFSVMRHIQKELNATVIGIHHHGKNKDRGASGSHYLIGGSDCMLDVYRDGTDDGVTGRWFTVSKNRLGQEGEEFHFELAELQPDYCDGYDYSLAFVQPCGGNAFKKGNGAGREKDKLSSNDKVFLSSVQAAISASGEAFDHPDYGNTIRVKLSQVKCKFGQLYQAPNSSADPKEAVRGGWRRALARLEVVGIIRDGDWLCQKQD